MDIIANALMIKAKRILKKFTKDDINFPDWLNHFEYLYDFLYIGNSHKAAFLLNMLEQSVFNALHKKVAPRKICKLPYDDLISELEEMYFSHPNVSAIDERFAKRNLMVGESVNEYSVVLLKLLEECRPSIDSSNQLINQFIQGLNSIRMKKELQAIKSRYIFSDLVAIALRMEYQEINHIKETMLLPNLD